MIPGSGVKKGLAQNDYRFVILRDEVTKDLSFVGFHKL